MGSLSLCQISLCQEFNLFTKFINCCRKNKDNNSEEDFRLIKTIPKKYIELVPRYHDYIYLKILKSGKIISVSGGLLKFFNLKTKDLLNINLNEIRKCTILFEEYIGPLFESCLEKNISYQFIFKFKKKIFSCSLYPCWVPDKLCSIDIVMRPYQNTINNNEDDDHYAIV